MEKGYVSMIFHSHLPFVRHEGSSDAMEEHWLFEAIHECYLPLLEVAQRLINDHVPFRITISLSPTLITMLQDDYLKNRFVAYMEQLLRLAEIELLRTSHQQEFHRLAKYYHERIKRQLEKINAQGFDFLASLRKLEASGHASLITTAATHAFLPLMLHHPEAIHAQLRTAIHTFETAFGHKPEGIWLPECAYDTRLDQFLAELGMRYFISENITVLHSLPGSIYGTFTPVATAYGTAIFPRDADASRQVWSNIHGYPAHEDYREFYRDIGHDLPMSYLQQSGFCIKQRHDTGIKYYKVTGNTEQKLPYDRDKAMQVAAAHGRAFARSRFDQIEALSADMNVPPIITCPFDTELFGHWWYEGPEFLESFIREAASYAQMGAYSLATPSDYLNKNSTLQCVDPAPGSWGENGDFSLWLNRSNDWIVRELYKCRELMVSMSAWHSQVEAADTLSERTLKQAARELMLAEASDWQFMISRNTATAYAIQRVTEHLENCTLLLQGFHDNKIDAELLARLEQANNIFPDLDYTLYRKR